ncbi:hypothetical protein [Priestia koreensis]|uniref:hypothetical protein n=1 Tax=Priestia koreensis TaxID=284581 RepID=UPI003017647F
MGKILIKLSLFVVPLVIIFIFKIDYSSFSNIDNILLGSIALSSAAMGFFIAGVAIMQTSNFSRFYKALTDLGTDKKIMSWLMTSIGYMFFLASFSLVGLFLVLHISGIVIIFLNIWLAFLCASLLSTLFIILIFAIVFTK